MSFKIAASTGSCQLSVGFTTGSEKGNRSLMGKLDGNLTVRELMPLSGLDRLCPLKTIIVQRVQLIQGVTGGGFPGIFITRSQAASATLFALAGRCLATPNNGPALTRLY